MPSRKATRSDDGRISANRPRKTAVKPKSRYQQLLDGDISVEDLDDEEIMAGRVKDAGGHFRGRPPNTFPRAIHDGLRMEFNRRVQARLSDGTQKALDTLQDVMDSRHAAAPARVRAAEVWLERTLGKVPDKVMASVEIKKFEEDLEGLIMDIKDDDVHVITTKEIDE